MKDKKKMGVLLSFGEGYKGARLPLIKPKKEKKEWVAGKGSRAALPISYDNFLKITSDMVEKEDYRLAVIAHLLWRCVRIGDICKTLKISDVYLTNSDPKPQLDYVEEKTKKRRIIDMDGGHFKMCLDKYVRQIIRKRRDAPLFYNLKHRKPLTTRGVQFLLSEYVGEHEIEQLSPHSLRKGGGRYMWENGARIETIRDMYNHHDTKVTERYICITAVHVSDAMKCFKY